MNRIVIQEGYTLPFAAYRRRKRRSGAHKRRSGGAKRMQTKMRTCAKKWRHHRGGGKYTSFMKKCLKAR